MAVDVDNNDGKTNDDSDDINIDKDNSFSYSGRRKVEPLPRPNLRRTKKQK